MDAAEVTAFLIEHSPPESGPVYLFLAEHWDLVSGGLTLLFAVMFLFGLSLAASVYLEISE